MTDETTPPTEPVEAPMPEPADMAAVHEVTEIRPKTIEERIAELMPLHKEELARRVAELELGVAQ